MSAPGSEPRQEPSRDVLEHNLARLLRRSYSPARPAPAFVARLERRLAGWIGAPTRAPLRAAASRRPLGWAVAAGLAAAAALLFLLLPGGQEPRSTRGSDLDQLFVQGLSAVRAAGAGEAWFALAEDGRAPRSGPAEALAAGRRVELASPPQAEGRFAVPSAARFGLGPDTRAGLRVTGAEPARLEGELTRGSLSFELLPRAALSLVAGELEALLTGSGRIALRPAPASLGPHAGPRAVHISLHAGTAQARTARARALLAAPQDLWVVDGLFLHPDGRPYPYRTPASSESERTPLGSQAAPEAALSDPAPDTAFLAGRVRAEGALAPPVEVRVTLLRAVPLPAVAWPESRLFELEGEPRAFRWEGLEPGTYLVQVVAEGLAPASVPGIVLAAGDGLELDLVLARGATLAGHVVDAETGAPLAGALVISESDAPVQILGTRLEEVPDEVRARALSGPDGGFVLTELTPGAQRLRASHPERAPRWLEVQSLRAGEERAGLLLELGPGGAIEGRVEEPGGAARSGAEIIASHSSGADGRGLMTYGSATTDAEGRYSIAHLAPGTYVVLDLGAAADVTPQEVRPRFSFTAVQEGRTARVDFLAPPELAVLTGRLLDGEGEPLERGMVQLVPRRADGSWAGDEALRSTAIEADGSFTLAGLEGGSYGVYAGSGDAAVLREVIELPARGRLERTYRLGGSALRGRVLAAEDATPLARAVLIVRSLEPLQLEGVEVRDARDLVAAKAWTAGDGSFRIEHLAPGRYALLAVDESPARALALVSELEVPARAPLELRLAQGGALELLVTDAAGEPAGGCALELSSPSGAPFGDWIDALTDAEGRARVTRLEPGRWTVVAVRAGTRSAALAIDVVPGQARSGRLVLSTD